MLARLLLSLTLILCACATERRSVILAPTGIDDRPIEPPSQRQVDQKRLEAINLIKSLLAKDTPTNPELLHRLASLLDEQGAAQEMASYDAAPEKAVELESRAEASRQEAADLYQRLLDSHPRYDRNDEILYALASLKMGPMAQPKEGLALITRLIKGHPQSAFQPHAMLILGEHYFNNNNLTLAMKAYQKVLAIGEPTTAPYARYKLAWCQYNIQAFHKAMIAFIVLSRSDNAALAKEARRDATMLYAEIGRPEEALTWFKALHGNTQDGKKQTERLVALYRDIGKVVEAQFAEKTLQSPPMQPGRAVEKRLALASKQFPLGKYGGALTLIDAALVMTLVMPDNADKKRLLGDIETSLVEIFDKGLAQPGCKDPKTQQGCASHALELYKVFFPNGAQRAALQRKFEDARKTPKTMD